MITHYFIKCKSSLWHQLLCVFSRHYASHFQVSQWEKPKEWREYEVRLAEQERLNAEQERITQQVRVLL